MLYGALPGTETLKLSVPHQNPGGASPAGSRVVALAVPALVSTSARPAARASQVRFIMPPEDSRFPSMRPRTMVTYQTAGLWPNPPGHGETEGGQGAWVVQDGRA